MRVTRTRQIAGQQNHLLDGVAEEQVYWVTYNEIPDELWHKVMAIKQAEKQAEKMAKGKKLGHLNKFRSVPKDLLEKQFHFNMSQ